MFRRHPVITPLSTRWAAAALLAACSAACAPAWAAPASTPTQPKAAGATVTLNFADAAIDAVARTMATLTGRNVVVDPRVKGTVTLQSTNPVTPAEALRLFSAQLRAQGFALVDSEGIYVVLPEADAKLQSASVSAGPVKGGGRIQTQIFRLTHESANNLVPVLRPLISPNNTINVDPGANALVITDYGDNLQRIARIIATLDVADATGIEIVRLHYAVASDLAPLVAKLLEPGSGGAPNAPRPIQPGNANTNASAAASVVGSGEGYRTTLIPEPRSNAIIVRAANPARLAIAKSLIEQLDQPADTRDDAGDAGNIHVVYLKNADAAKLAVTLRAALAALPGQQGAGAAPGNTANTAAMQPMQNAATPGNTSSTGLNSGPTINAAASNQPSTGGQIQADPATNSLIISAPEPVYRQLRAVIDKIDQRRAQVYVESLIAEVNTNRAADLGIQWQSFLGKNGGTNVGYIGSNFGNLTTTGNSNIIGLSGAFSQLLTGNDSSMSSVSLPNTGFNLGLLHNFGGGYVLSALANFIQSSGSGNVLSTPTLLTLDNEEARIMVGQNVPIVTGSYANTGINNGTGYTGNPFTTMDRQDVGITLRVRPQISEDGSIKLVIYQEVSSIDLSTKNDPNGLTTNKRAIESSVIVNDGQIIVLGGLLSDEMDTTEDKVPLLGDIPVVGNLFKNQNHTYAKKNLMVFLRPVIVRDAAATESYSLDRYDYMRALQQGTQPASNPVLDIGSVPVMPAAMPVNPQTADRPAPPAPLIQAMPRDAGGASASKQPQSLRPASGDVSDVSGAPIKTGR